MLTSWSASLRRYLQRWSQNWTDGRTWYLPHHGVYHLKNPNKIPVIYDCAASYEGVSLNHLLLQCPDLTSNLFQVLLKFRQENIAVVRDVDAIFHQIMVVCGSYVGLRETMNRNQEPIEYWFNYSGLPLRPAVPTMLWGRLLKTMDTDFLQLCMALLNITFMWKICWFHYLVKMKILV